MCHNLAHGDLLGMGYEMWGMGNGACGVVGHGCSPFLAGCGDGCHWCRTTALLYAKLIVLWCRPRGVMWGECEAEGDRVSAEEPALFVGI